MYDVFRLRGSYECGPASGSPSGDPDVVSSLFESLLIKTKTVGSYLLTADGPVDISFGSLSAAHVVVLSTTGGKVTARLTSADGSQQSVPVDPLGIVISQSAPFTAIDVERTTGVETTVRVFLGERA